MTRPYSELWHREFAQPVTWLMKGRGLRRAGDRLMMFFDATCRARTDGAPPGDPALDDSSFGGTALMLYGFALENVLKGLLIASDQSIVARAEADGRFRWEGSGHQLLDLGERAGMRWEGDTRLYVSNLEEQILWQGRYPTTLRAAEHKELEWGWIGGELSSAWLTRRFHEIFAGAEQRFQEALNASRVSAPAPSPAPPPGPARP
jgi:hypothetical protein